MDMHRLRWASRRGMLELDLILLPFLENHYALLSDEHKQWFQDLLLSEDQDLFRWFLGKGEPDDEHLAEIVRVILSNTGIASSQR